MQTAIIAYLWAIGTPLAWRAVDPYGTEPRKAAIVSAAWPVVIPFFLLIGTLAVAFAPRKP